MLSYLLVKNTQYLNDILIIFFYLERSAKQEILSNPIAIPAIAATKSAAISFKPERENQHRHVRLSANANNNNKHGLRRFIRVQR